MSQEPVPDGVADLRAQIEQARASLAAAAEALAARSSETLAAAEPIADVAAETGSEPAAEPEPATEPAEAEPAEAEPAEAEPAAEPAAALRPVASPSKELVAISRGPLQRPSVLTTVAGLVVGVIVLGLRRRRQGRR